MAAANVLDRELSTFSQKKPELVAQSLGKFAVVSGDRILAVCDSYEDALLTGYEQVGLDDPFLVRQIEESETIHHVYRGSLTEC